MFDRMGDARVAIEAALSDPGAPGALDGVNAAKRALAGVAADRRTLLADSQALRDEIDRMLHIGAHPRQSDVPAEQWDWGNLFLGRRTDAFVRATLDRGRTPRSVAFAFGALCSYAGNAAGSAYLGQVVGGPRRSHRFRHGAARRTMGAWFRATRGLPATGAMAAVLRRSTDGGISEDLFEAVTGAFADAFPRRPPPDIGLGIGRTVRHLELLDTFSLPSLPPPPRADLAPLLELAPPGDLAGRITPLAENAFGGPPPGGGGGGSGTTGADSKKANGNLCVLVILVAVLLVVIIIDCIVQLIDHGSCNPMDTINEILGTNDEGLEATSAAGLVAAAQAPSGAELVLELHTAHMAVWKALSSAQTLMAQCGLVYPDGALLGVPFHGQFLSARQDENWPRKEDPAAEDRFHRYPTTAGEHPLAGAQAFPLGAEPDAFLNGIPGWHSGNAAGLARDLWLQVARGQAETVNLDQDADRGLGHSCWRVKAGASISDDPLAIEALAYDEV